jgi:hypothetical protein
VVQVVFHHAPQFVVSDSQENQCARSYFKMSANRKSQIVVRYTSISLSLRAGVPIEYVQIADIIQLMALRLALALGTLMLLAGPGVGQERFKSGKYKGFTEYTAFAIVELSDPFTVREAKGVVISPNSNIPLPNVLVEFRDAGGKITGTKTDSRGEFKFRKLRNGTYMFKTTLDGFQSVVGTVILQKSIKKSDAIRIEMPFGV